MARTARGGRPEALRPRRLTRALALATAAAACAAPQDPPGGPPDFTPPVLAATTPDSGATGFGVNQRVRFAFNEVIAERDLDQLVTVSPRHEHVDVNWDRDGFTVRPSGGWRADVAYVVRLAGGLLDLRNNRMPAGATVVFATGTTFPAAAVRGTIVDWEGGRRAVGALIEAIRSTDSLTHVAIADSSGEFTLPFLGAGAWTVVGTVDGDNNRRRGRREAFDSTVVTLGPADTAGVVLFTFVHDTAGPGLREASRFDSVTVQLTFASSLDPAPPAASAVRVFLLPDTVPVEVDRVMRERPATAAAAADTGMVADTAGRQPERPPQPPPDTAAAAPDTVLAMRPTLTTTWFVRLAAPLVPGARYIVEATGANPGGAVATTRTVLILPEPPPEPETPPDSLDQRRP